MININFYNNKEIKKLNSQLKEQFGNEFDFSKYLVYKTPKDRVYIINKEISKLDFSKLNINNAGLYFLNIEKSGLRLSIDGSQIYTPKKNILELNEKQFQEWMSGKDLFIEEKKGYYIIKYKTHFLGCGYSNNNKILNYVPKERRVLFK